MFINAVPLEARIHDASRQESRIHLSYVCVLVYLICQALFCHKAGRMIEEKSTSAANIERLISVATSIYVL